MLKGATAKVNESLKKYTPVQIIAMAYGALAIPLFYNLYHRMTLRQKKLLIERFFMRVLKLPLIGFLLQKKIDIKLNPAKKEIDESLHKDRDFGFEPLPNEGLSEEELLTQARVDSDASVWSDQMSGAQYLLPSLNLPKFAAQIFEVAAYSNPMHTSAWGRIKQRENQLLAWCDELFHGKGDIRGNVTPGGTYSIFEAMGAYSSWAEKRGIAKPNVVAPRSAHPAFTKACQKFKLDLIEVPVDPKTIKADIKAMSRAINSNTICLIGSASNFSTGSIDDIAGLSDLAIKHNIGLHVDMCLGGGVVPFAEEAGVKLDPCDFSLPGVSSISADAHKFFLAPKETSIVMFRRWIFAFQGMVNFGSAGTYASVGIAGSRSGAMILLVLSIMAHVGRNGYVKITKNLFALKDKLVAGIQSIEGLQIYGSPDLTTVAFAFDDKHAHLNIHCVTGKMMNDKKWYFIEVPTTQGLSDRPFSHFTLTAFHLQNSDFVDRFLSNLKECTKYVKDHPKEIIGSSTKTYASIGKIPDTMEFLKEKIGLYYIYSNSSLRPVYQESKPAEKSYWETTLETITEKIQRIKIW